MTPRNAVLIHDDYLRWQSQPIATQVTDDDPLKAKWQFIALMSSSFFHEQLDSAFPAANPPHTSIDSLPSSPSPFTGAMSSLPYKRDKPKFVRTRPLNDAGLPTGMKTFYDSGTFTDLTIVCGKEEFRCHKVVVCSQSEFFRAACGGGFKETTTSTINFPDDNPALIKIMLDFMYTWSYDLPKPPDEGTNDLPHLSSSSASNNNSNNDSNSNDNDPNGTNYDQRRCKFETLDTIISLYVLGDKYDIPRLRDHAALDFETEVQGLRDTANKDIANSDYIEVLLGCVERIYECLPESDRRLKDVLIGELLGWYCEDEGEEEVES
ncbi:MAG: hypothetical protein Q9168_007891 [Polycauliona sp. 1 TL-2023]